MPKDPIFNFKAAKDQTDSQTTGDIKNKRRFFFLKRTAEAEENVPSTEIPDEQEADSAENDIQTDAEQGEAAKSTSGKLRLQFPTFHKRKSSVQQEEPNTQVKEDTAEVDKQSVEEKEIVSQDFSDKFREIVGKILPEDQEDTLTYQLLDYLDTCLESGKDPDWDYITRGNDGGEDSLLQTSQKYITNYLLGTLLQADYVEGFVVDCHEDSKQLRVTTGIQITRNGRKHLKELSGMGRIGAFLRSVKDCTPRM